MVELKAGVPNVRALDRGLALLASFTAERSALTLSELARLASLDKNTARRLLQTLIANQFVFHDPINGRYGLTSRILHLASAVQVGADIRVPGERFVNEVADQTGATSFLWVHSDGMAVCLARAVKRLANVEAVWFSVGGRAALNAGAGPRVLLAFIDEKERQMALERPMDVRTPRAETDPARLKILAKHIRKNGWAFAADDFVVGLAGLGVPVLSASGKLLGSLSISTMTSGYGDIRSPRHLQTLQLAAASLGHHHDARLSPI